MKESRDEILARMKKRVDQLDLLPALLFLAYLEVSALWEWVKDIPRSWAMWQAGK